VFADTSGQGAPMRAQAGEGWQQRGMDVDDATAPGFDDARIDQAQVTGADDQPGLLMLDAPWPLVWANTARACTS